MPAGDLCRVRNNSRPGRYPWSLKAGEPLVIVPLPPWLSTLTAGPEASNLVLNKN